MSLRRIAGLIASLLASSFAIAGPVTTTGATAGTPLDVIGITGFDTLGSGMAGLSVTAVFAQSGSVECVWAATSATAGGCSAPGLFQIQADGNTFSAPWRFQNTSTFDVVTALLLNGTPQRSTTSGTVFDRRFNDALGTPGSDRGTDASGSADNTSGLAEYSDSVAVGAAAPLGDLYSVLTIDFDPGLGPGGFAFFVADTDTIGSQVPEPGSVGLLGLGLAGLAMLRRRR